MALALVELFDQFVELGLGLDDDGFGWRLAGGFNFHAAFHAEFLHQHIGQRAKLQFAEHFQDGCDIKIVGDAGFDIELDGRVGDDAGQFLAEIGVFFALDQLFAHRAFDFCRRGRKCCRGCRIGRGV